MTKARENFSPAVKKQIAERAMYICADPTCYRLTGYATTKGKARTIAEAAHVNAAAKGGPRANSQDSTYLKSPDNGIWLCSTCHKKVDDDTDFYSEQVLKKWKEYHEDVIRRIVGKDLEAALIDLRNHKRYHDETRGFLSFLEDKRVLFEGLDLECPPRVLESLELIRAKIVQTRASVAQKSGLSIALSQLQKAIFAFLRDVGTDTDLKTLRCNPEDPKWRKFAEELHQLRGGLDIIIKVLAKNADYNLAWM